jgi:hypothetical protein
MNREVVWYVARAMGLAAAASQQGSLGSGASPGPPAGRLGTLKLWRAFL